MDIPFGFKLQYHKSIPYSIGLEGFLRDMLERFVSEDSYKQRRTSKAYFRRGIVGYLLDENFKWGGEVYTFKRLTRKGRRFGVMPLSELNIKGGLSKQCRCAIHAGGTKATLKNKYNDSDWVTFATVGVWR